MGPEQRVADLEREVEGLKADLALARAEAQRGQFFRRIVETSSDPIAVADRSGTVTYASPSYQATTGRAAEELVGSHFLAHTHLDRRDRFMGLFSELWKRPPSEVIRVEGRHQAKSGEWIDTEVVVRNLTDDPLVRGAVFIARNIGAAVRVREELRAAQSRYEHAMMASKEAIWDQEIATGVMDFSPEMPERLGYSLEEFPRNAEGIRDLFHPDDHFVTKRAAERRLSGEGPMDVEVRVRTKGGEYRWYRVVGDPIFAEDGTPLRFVGRASDVHERKIAEIALHDSERMFRALFEDTSVAVTLRDVDTQKFIDCNAAALKLYGLERREQLFDSTPDELAPERQPDGRTTREMLREYVGRALASGSARMVWMAKARGGALFPAEVRTTIIALEDGRRVMQTFIEDVSERRRNEEHARRRGAHDELIGEVARRFLNDDPEAATGVTVERVGELLGAENVSLFAVDERAPRLRCTHFWSAQGPAATFVSLEDYPVPASAPGAAEARKAGQLRSLPHDQVEAWLETLQREAGKRVLYARVGYGGQVFGLLGARARDGRTWTDEDAATLRMVGELIAVGRVRRAAELALARATENAIAASRTKSAFLANMSHELRTPLNGVIGMVDLLATTPLDERQRRYTEIARTSASLLLSVISDILDFSKIEAGKLELEAVAVSVSELVEEVASIVALGAEEKGIELSCRSDAALAVPLVGDPARLRQVLVNLVSNAIKFTRQGEVSVRASAVAESATGMRVRVEVRDTGVGIPLEAQARLFQPFTQVDASTTREHGGTGLGLAICRELVERMRGTIGLDSAPGRGSVFWFEVPLGRSADVAGPVVERDALLAGLRVLAVDDNGTNRDLLRAHLEAIGMVCDTAADGEEALRLLEAAASRAPYVLAILDHHMPKMDGRELARRIKENPRLRATSVVMLGSVGSPLTATEQRAAGILGYCTKPIWRKELLRVLRAALDAQAPRRPRTAPPPAFAHARAGSSAARILLVEDSVINAEVAGEILRSAGYTFDCAVDGALAIEAARAGHYDLILMDCQLPEVDGYEATRQIRALERDGILAPTSSGGPVPIVALTASATTDDLNRCFTAGMTDHVSKPVDARRLLAVIASRLEHPPAAAKPSSAPPKPSVPVVDLERALGRLSGDRTLLRRIAALFVEAAPATRDKLRAAVEARAQADIAFAMHRLRGQASTFGGDALVVAASALEEAAQRGNWAAAGATLLGVEKELDRLLSALAAGTEARGPASSWK